MVIDTILEILNKYDIRYKENSKNIIILCPFCLEEGKEKIKLYIDKERFIWHCFRCNNSGNINSLVKIVFPKLGIHKSDIYTIYNNIIENLLYNEGNDRININHNNIAIKSLIQIERKKNIEEINKFSISLNNIISDNSIKTYRYELMKYINYINNERRIDYTHFISLFKDIIYFGIKGKLKNRIIGLTYFKTNYEARSIYNIEPKYLKRSVNNNIPDYIYIELGTSQFNVINNNSNWYNISTSSLLDNIRNNNDVNKRKLIIAVEGFFDFVKLSLNIDYNLYQYINTYKYNSIGILSLSGYSKISNIIPFLELISEDKNNNATENNINIQTDVLIVFDKDIDINTNSNIKNVLKDIIFRYSDGRYNIKFITFRYDNRYKDIGDIEDYYSSDIFEYIISETKIV